MTNWKVLLWALVVLGFCFCFYNVANASEVETAPVLVAPAPEPAPAQSQTSENLIDNNNWDGATYGADPGGCCASVSGSGALYDTTTDTIMFSYGQDILSQTIAINQALQQSGIEVDGYNYGWTWRTISNNGNGGDTLQFEVTVKDAAGNEVERYVYDYSSADHAMDVWHTESGTETFAQSYLDPQNIALKIIGKDGGFWAGYYGPEVKDVSLTLNYSANPCAADPLYDPSCEGYADAYAQQQYDLNCQADPLYDPGCPGYQQAYYNQQCTANPLYDAGCPGYQQAYFEQQCSMDPFYDQSCPGYAQAYFDQQCSLDPLYDQSCPGYAQAYFDQQCSADVMYDAACPGYDDYVLSLLPATTESTNDESHHTDTTPTITATEDPVAELTQTPLVSDPVVNNILTQTAPLAVASVELEPVVEMETANEPEPETESSSDVEQSMDSAGNNQEIDPEQSDGGSSSDDSEGGSESGESDGNTSTKEEKSDKDSKREKLKKIIAKKAANLANDMSEAASLEAQQAIQARVLALISYVPDFNTYNGAMSGGYYPDSIFYQQEQLPESRRGLRNGLAQQLLHEKMVEMQYNN